MHLGNFLWGARILSTPFVDRIVLQSSSGFFRRHLRRDNVYGRRIRWWPVLNKMSEGQASPEKRCRALVNLLSAVDSLLTDFSCNINEILAPVVEQALRESEGEVALPAVLHAFGWENDHFVRPVDIRALSSRLKALMFHGLQEKGKGSYAVVYKVRVGGQSFLSKWCATSLALAPVLPRCCVVAVDV